MAIGTHAHGSMEPGALLQFLRQVSLFGDVPITDLQGIAPSVRTLTFKKGGRIFEEGSVAGDCFVLTMSLEIGQKHVLPTPTRGGARLAAAVAETVASR